VCHRAEVWRVRALDRGLMRAPTLPPSGLHGTLTGTARVLGPRGVDFTFALTWPADIRPGP